MNEKKKEMYVLMYATLEANSHCNKKREGEKKEGRLKNCGNTARQPVRQTDRESRVCEHDERTRFTFFFLIVVLLLMYSSFVLFSLDRTFCASKTRILSFYFNHLEIELQACATSGSTNRIEKIGGKKKDNMSIVEKNYITMKHLRSEKER